MLTAFTARPIVELKARDKSKIESLVAYGDRLLVGLNTGVLRIYRVNDVEPADGSSAAEPENGGQPKRDEPTHLLREVEKFAPRSIDQLAIIKEANTLVSLANYAVSLHDLQSFAPLPGAAPLPGTKNAACFAVTSNIVKDPATGIPEIVSRLAVAVKRRLLLWSWYASELSGGGSNGGRNGGGGTSDGQAAADGNTGGDGRASMAPSEITLSETIRSLTWASATKLVVGMNAGYVLVDVLTRVVDEIEGGAVAGANGSNGEGASSRFGALGSASMGYMGLGSYMPKPLAAKLADGEVLLAKDVHTLFITDTGKPLDRRGIPWPAAPESVGYSYPYILALQPPAKGSLEVRNPKTLSLLQTIAVPSAMQLHVPPPSVSLAHAGKGFHVSSERGIWKMDATAYDDQVATLVGHGHLDEAISLLGMLEDALLRNKTETLRSIKMQKADMLFRKKRYLEAMDLFNEEDVHAPPERVFRFFPRSIVGDLSDEVVAAPAPIPDQDNEQSSKAGAEAEGEEAGSKNGDVDESEEGGAADADAEASAATATNGKNGTTDGEPAPAAATPPQTQQAPEPTLLAGGFTKAFWGHRKLNSDAASIASGVAGADSETVSVKGKPAAAATTATTATAAAATAVATGAHDATTHANGYVPLEGKELVSAAEALNSYLAGTRARLQRVIDPATGKLKKKARGSNAGAGAGISQGGRRRSSMLDSDSESGVDDDMTREARLRATFTLVDTTMFRVLMLIRPKLASSLFRIPNFCDPNVVNERLLEHSRFNELVDFFYGKRLHRPALELLKRFGDVDRAAEKGEGEDEKTASTKGKDGNDASGSASIVPPALRGPRRTIVYLQSLPPEMIDLILEFAGWTLRADPVHSMDVFLADSENAETLPRDRVVRFLAGIDPLLEMRYLEHIIGELNDLTPDFHNRLIEQMIKLLKEGGEGPDGEKTQEDDDDVDKTKIKDWAPTMARLVAFLNDSRQYSLSRAFGLIPRDGRLTAGPSFSRRFEELD